MTSTADRQTDTSEAARYRSLRRKVFLPYALLTIVLCSSAVVGALYLADISFRNSTDQRLEASSEVLFREFKKQETILQTYAVIIEQFQGMVDRFGQTSDIGLLQDHLFTTLERSRIDIAFYPADISGLIRQESLVDLFNQVRRSSRPRFRYSNEFNGGPVLMVAAPVIKRGKVQQIILLKTAMGETFLRNATRSLGVAASLLTIDGRILASSEETDLTFKLSPAQLNQLDNGRPIYSDDQSGDRDLRRLFSIIPLGSSDMVLLSLSAPLKERTAAQQMTLLQMIAGMLAFVLIATIYFYRRVTSLTQPARALRDAAEEVARGNLGYRIKQVSNDELGQIAHAFNSMVERLEGSYLERSDQEIAAAVAREESRARQLLERKEIERERLNEELRILQHEASAMFQLNQAMTASIELKTLFDRILQVLNEIIDCDHIVLLIHNSGESTLEVVCTSGIDREALDKVRFTFDQGITGEAARAQRLIYVKDLAEDERNLSYHGQVATRGSMISVPLTVKGRLVGALNLHKKELDAFSVSDQRLIQAVANQTAVAIDNAQLREKSRELSNTDELTGLANRRQFQDILKREVAQARRFSSNLSIVMCDIDRFTAHRGTLGPVSSDALLRDVGQLLLAHTRGIDLVSRFGTDQFIILLPKTGKKGAMAAAEKLRQRVEEEDFSRKINSARKIKLTLSFGATEFPVDSKNIYELLNLADRALYAAKQQGGNCVVDWEGPAPGPD
jgi:diguanylate cyclase (GGDEF)-like protein